MNNLLTNYKKFITETTSLEDIKNIIFEDTVFSNYINTMTKNYPTHLINKFAPLIKKYRQDIIQESLSSPDIIPFAVVSFPILLDIYLNNKLYSCIYPYLLDSPNISLTKFKCISKIRKADGSTDTYYIPRLTFPSRYPETTVNLSVGNNNLFDICPIPNVNKNNTKINKSKFYINGISFTVDVGSGNETVNISHIKYEPTARNSINEEFIGYTSTTNTKISGKLTVNIDFDTGNINSIITTVGNYSLSDINITLKVVYTPIILDTPTSVIVEQKTIVDDYFIDVNDEFEFSLLKEIEDNYQSIYNINLVEKIIDAITKQISCNIDYDISNELQNNEYNMFLNRSYEDVNLQTYRESALWISSQSLYNIIESIVYREAVVAEVIYMNYRMKPTYLLCGLKTYPLIYHLKYHAKFESNTDTTDITKKISNDQEITVDIDPNNYFSQYEILYSPMIPDDRIYLVANSSDDPVHASFIDMIYKPLYKISETTQSLKRNVIRSRNKIKLTKPEAAGVIIVRGLDNIITMFTDNFRPNI